MRYPAQFHPVVGCSQLTLAHEGQLLVGGASMLRDSNSVQRCHIGWNQSSGVFTPGKSANKTNQGFLFLLESYLLNIYKQNTAFIHSSTV